MSEKRFRVNDLVKYDYSEIGEYIDENHTDRPLRNDEVCDLLNEQQAIIDEQKIAINEMITDYKELEEENEQLKKQLEIRTASDKYHQRMLTKWLCKDE